jgi:hypothetical protein
MNPQDYKRIVTNIKVDENLQNRIKQKIINNKQLPFYKSMPVYRYGLISACIIVLMGMVLVIPKLNEISNPSIKDTNSSISKQSSQTISSNTAAITKQQDNSSKASLSDSSKNQSGVAQVNSTSNSSNTTAPSVIHGPNMIDPVMLNYNHNIYCTDTSTVITAKLDDVLGNISYEGNERDVFSVQGVSFLNNICISPLNKTHDPLQYRKYDYLCDEECNFYIRLFSFPIYLG